MSDGKELKKEVRLNDTREEKEEDGEDKAINGKTDWSKRVITEEYDPELLKKVREFDQW